MAIVKMKNFCLSENHSAKQMEHGIRQCISSARYINNKFKKLFSGQNMATGIN
jgi:hypothetical protein